MPGVSLGAEEKKTGIKGSSTRPLILTDAVIPKENLLGEIGKGHKIAFNILNIGRFKLGAMVTGGAKLTVAAAAEYGNSRTAFGQPITSFGLIKHKIGQMAILAYVSESIVYRTAGMIDRNLADVGLDDPETALKRIEEYDVECSMVKVWCSEMCDYVVDENVQIFGGAGYVEDYPAERYWRDARVNRIYEGTNEINRLLVPGRLIRRALKGELPIFQKAMALLDELTSGAVRRGARGGLPGRRGRACSPGPRRWPSCAWGRRCRSAARRSRTSRRSSATSPTSPWRPTPSRARSCGPGSGRRRAARTRRGCRRRPCAATPRTRWTRSRPRPASSWPRWRRATRSARCLAALKRFTKREVVQHRRPAAAGRRRRHRAGRLPARVGDTGLLAGHDRERLRAPGGSWVSRPSSAP